MRQNGVVWNLETENISGNFLISKISSSYFAILHFLNVLKDDNGTSQLSEVSWT